jgi:hypothetical protein
VKALRQYRQLDYRWWAPVSLGAAAVSLLALPDGLGYDPWSWMVWGRELFHGTLVTSGAASSIKPLPVLVDTVLAPFGAAAPYLWLCIARAGVVISVVLVYHLARSLAGHAAAIFAAVGWLTTSQVAGYLTFEGMSEPLCAALVLAGVDAHLGGHRGRAIVLWAVAGLVRIELWPFVAIYGLYVLWKSPRPKSLTAASLAAVLAAVPVAWLLPDALSSGDLLRSAARARLESQGGPLVTSHPGLSTLVEAGGMLLWPLAAAFVLEMARGVYAWAKHRHLRATLVIACGAVGWVVLEASLVQLRFATGAPRYLLPGIVMAAIVAGCAWSDALGGLLSLMPRAKTGLVLALAWVALFGASSYGLVERARATTNQWGSARQVERLASELPRAVAQLGGRAAVLSCGTIAAAPLQNPAVAWRLDIALGDVGISPSAHGVVFVVAGQPRVPKTYAGDYRSVGSVGPTSARWTNLSTCPRAGKTG